MPDPDAMENSSSRHGADDDAVVSDDDMDDASNGTPPPSYLNYQAAARPSSYPGEVALRSSSDGLLRQNDVAAAAVVGNHYIADPEGESAYGGDDCEPNPHQPRGGGSGGDPQLNHHHHHHLHRNHHAHPSNPATLNSVDQRRREPNPVLEILGRIEPYSRHIHAQPNQPDEIPSTEGIMEKYFLTTNCTKRRWYIGGGVAFVLLLLIIIIATTAGGRNKPMLSPEQIETILRLASHEGGIEFDDPSSYQYQALLWNQNNPVRREQRLLQRYALVCIYYATYQKSNRWLQVNKAGDDLFKWDTAKGWLTFDDECDWFGVGCDRHGHVTDLDLGKNDLSGHFPPEVAHLAKTLVLLNIESNYFYNRGPRGTDFFGRLSNLQYLYLKDTLVQNEGLPLSFGLMTKIKELDCSYSLLHGPLHEEIFTKLDQLKYLEISGNSVDGTIPTTLTALPRLKYFYASLCDLKHDSLDFLEGMPSLVETWLDRNPGLTGSIPPAIGTLSTLESISVTRCKLSGPIPTELGQLTGMQQMWFYNNTLSGTIPTELGLMTDLETLELEDNNLTGEMPSQVCDLKADAFAESSKIKTDTNLYKVHADCDYEIECDCCDCCGPECNEKDSQPLP